LKVNVISESAFTVQGHGVHSAFTDTVDALRDYTDCDVMANSGRRADLIHIHTVGPYSLVKLVWGGGAKVVSAHVMPESFVGSLVGAKYWYGIAKMYLRWFYNRSDGVVAVSGEVVDELAKMGVHKPVYLVPNSINTQSFVTTQQLRMAARKEFGIPENAFVVIGSGQVQPRKRIDTFVAAAKTVSNAQFIWVGGMPFKKLAADSGAMAQVMHQHPDNVIFTGQVKREEVMKYFNAADLFFFPSIQETFGLVIVEAAAAGLPILLRDLVGYQQTFGDGYEKGTDETFGATINRFQTDQTYYRSWKQAAKKISERYDTKAGAVRLLHVYHEVINQRANATQTKSEA